MSKCDGDWIAEIGRAWKEKEDRIVTLESRLADAKRKYETLLHQFGCKGTLLEQAEKIERMQPVVEAALAMLDARNAGSGVDEAEGIFDEAVDIYRRERSRAAEIIANTGVGDKQ